MKALSIRQPWVWAILHAGKRVENRQWHPPRPLIGREFLLHASAGCTKREYREALECMLDAGLVRAGDCPALSEVPRGAIVGIAKLEAVILPGGLPSVGTRRNTPESRMAHPLAESPWYAPGQYGLVLSNVKRTVVVACKGALGFFEADAGAVRLALRCA